MNIVAEKVEFTVDIRSCNNDNINDITAKIREALDRETKAMGGSYEMDNLSLIHISNLRCHESGIYWH